jgi:transcription-repair coupling factor (superfamily II helicase)
MAEAAVVSPDETGETVLPAPRTAGALAVVLMRLAHENGDLIHMAASEERVEALARILAVLDPGLDIVVFPAWDCLPYDRASPSRETMGRRLRALRRLWAGGERPRIVLTTPDAALQRTPPREAVASAVLRLGKGEPLDMEALRSFFTRTGYLLDERVDEPGEAAIRGAVIDLFPAGRATPYRIEHQEGRIAAIHAYDPVSQRTIEDAEAIEFGPASEIVLPEAPEREAEGEESAQPAHASGEEHRLPEFYGTLETLFDALPEAMLVIAPEAEDRRDALLEQIADAYATRKAWMGREATGELRPAVEPKRLYLDEEEWAARLAALSVVRLSPPEKDGGAAVPRFATKRRPVRAFVDYVEETLATGRKLVVAAATKRDRNALARRLKRRLDRAPEPVESWEAVRAAPEGALLSLPLDLERGFVLEEENVAVVAAADLLGSRAEHQEARRHAEQALPLGEVELRTGDVVVHFDHGLGLLKGLETVTADDAENDMVRLEYAKEATLMVPVEETDAIWRYGADAHAVTLDKIDGGAWEERRDALEAELQETAARLVELAAARAEAKAPELVPPQRPYERFVARFPFSPTPDQADAIDAVLADLASGRPMDRLVCGDVGFGKTEVALRAAAAAALAGKQVAVVAPTTVLARQHYETFRRRFAGLDIEVGRLSRLATGAEASETREGLADGRVRVVIGTHALASKTVRFQDLGLLIIDEEQRFGTKHKEALRALGEGVHVLTLTATPIPRTLQSALVGLQEISIIATPPARRQPIRTFLTPFDPVSVREALLRERGRGGQSFFVCPRIEEIGPMAQRLKELVPELDLLVAHGQMKPEEIDDAMLRFADGRGDVLLATNIIESGLDVPCANTILIWRADRFGLSQLHQLRGRVGRGRMRGVAYLLTDPEHEIAPATRERLETLEALDRLGSGFAISARDLDLRGAGDIFGEAQAGHVKLIGVGLYQHLLERAVKRARGEALDDDWTPEVHLGIDGRIPADYVPEAEVRLNLYARLNRLTREDEIDALSDEIEDRFGNPPEEIAALFSLARLKRLARAAGVARLDAGPKGLALTFREGAATRVPVLAAVEESDGGLVFKGDRLVLAKALDSAEARQGEAERLLEKIANGEDGEAHGG